MQYQLNVKMLPLSKLVMYLYFFIAMSELSVLPVSGLPKLPQLPTPSKFLETLFNCTAKELPSLVSHFTFEEVLTEKIEFSFYNKNGSVTTFDADSKEYPIIHVSEPIKLIIPGWLSSGNGSFMQDMAKSYHSIGIDNVFSVDWSPYSRKLYLASARATKKTGEIVGNFVMNLLKNNTNFLKNVHIIGHSLGAHICGFAGKQIQNLTNGHKVGRITGLDAAGPLFEYPKKNPSNLRLTHKDARFVDTIHTDAGFLGFASSLGDADYFVDLGGPIQKACVNINVIKAITCSHTISHTYFNISITSIDYLATSCKNAIKAVAKKCNKNKKVVMGEHTDETAFGNYFISIDKNDLPSKK